MEFGISLLSEHPTDRDPTECRDGLADQARLAERLGYDSLWVTERHFHYRTFFNNFQLLSLVAAETETIGVGTCITLVPMYNPLLLAEQTANADIFSDGRFTFGVGVGNVGHQEYGTLGIDGSRLGTRMTEAMELVQKLWTEDDVSYDGTEFSVSDVSIHPKPIQHGGPPVWFGGRSTPAVRRAADMGDAWIPSPLISLPELDAPIGRYREALDEFGTTPSARPIFREVFVAETREAALEAAKPHLEYKYEMYDFEHDDSYAGPEITADRFGALREDRFIIGTPGDVIDEIDRYVDRLGVDYLVVRSQWPGMTEEPANESYELFAKEVVPSFTR